MFYREAGDFKTSYRDDSQTFPIRLDRMGYYILMFVAFLVVPFFINDYWVNAVFAPFLIYAIAALGLNILTGYAGQVSLGTGGFMAVGAYASYKLMTSFPEVSILIHASRGSIWRWPRWPHSSSLCGSSTRCRGFTTIRRRAKSTRLNALSSVSS